MIILEWENCAILRNVHIITNREGYLVMIWSKFLIYSTCCAVSMDGLIFQAVIFDYRSANICSFNEWSAGEWENQYSYIRTAPVEKIILVSRKRQKSGFWRFWVRIKMWEWHQNSRSESFFIMRVFRNFRMDIDEFPTTIINNILNGKFKLSKRKTCS